MVQINFAQKTVNVKIVYYGPGMSGKTTNLEVVHQRAPETNRGDLTSISTDGDRTLFFDYMPLELGTVAGMRTCFQIYTVPGQVYYNSTRKLVLQGVDGVIFVADSSPTMMDQNLESLRNLEDNLIEYGKNLQTMPHVLQWNKRDLPDALDPQELDRILNSAGCPTFEAVANTGQGVFPTLKALAQLVLKSIMQETAGGGSGFGGAPAGAAPTPPAPPVPAVPAAPVGAGAAPPVQPIYPEPGAHGGAAGAPSSHPPGFKPRPQLAGGQPAMAPAATQQGHPSPADMMQSRAQGRPQQRQRGAGQQPARRPRAQTTPNQVASTKKKGSSSTILFIVLAAGAGAGLAFAALKFL